MRLFDVYEDIELSERLLFELLRRRLPSESISHKAMPSWDMHRAFVASKPYAHWYLIETRTGASVGAVYLTHQREIGVAVLPAARGKGYATRAIQELMRLHPGRFLANIAPDNAASIELFRKLGFGPEPIQITLEKTE